MSALFHCLAVIYWNFILRGIFWSSAFVPPGTGKLAYEDLPRDQQNAVLIHRWSLYAGSIT